MAFGDHHLLEDHDNLNTYEGLIRPSSSSPDRVPELPANRTELMIYGKTESSLKRNGIGGSNESQSDTSLTGSHSLIGTNSGSIKGALNKSDQMNGTFSMIVQDNPYSKALSVVIAVGCSLLILNILVFAGVFLHRDRTYRGRQNTLTSRNRANYTDPRGIQYKPTSRVKFTKVNDEQVQNCIQHCHYNVDSTNNDNFNGDCSGHYHYQHTSESCVGHSTGQGETDQCNCPLVNLTYYVCDCHETNMTNHVCKAIEERQEKHETVNIVDEQFGTTTQQLLEDN